MNTTSISGAQLRDMVAAGAALLDKNKKAVDALNVFPVPDGDTGTNMSMTMMSAVHETHGLPDDAAVSTVADALSIGALKGARGNSGVILSQIFRGFSRACKDQVVMDSALLSKALTMGSEAAYKAVMKPKEGTILTVSRSIAEKVAELAERGANVYRLFDTMIEEGEQALADTPNLLPILKEAGVVDSGGKGLLFIYRGFKMSLDGEDVGEFAEAEQQDTESAAAAASETDSFSGENIQYGYCTEFFIIHLAPDFSEEDVEKFRDHLEKLGDSVVVASDSDMVKVHVHSNSPGKILQMALRLGELYHLKIENMREQNRELMAERKRNEKDIGLISVSAGAGLDSVFKELAVDQIISGGQTMNPSIDTIATAIRKINARNVIILPNNSNIIMAAQQAAGIVECNVTVLPTKTIPQGIAAAMAYSPALDIQENTESMSEALQQVVSGSVTYAVRASKMNGTEVKQGDIIGLMDNHLCAVGQTVEDATAKLVQAMIAQKSVKDPTVTLFYGEGADEEKATALAQRLEAEFGEAEFLVQFGGQPLYYYYISVE